MCLCNSNLQATYYPLPAASSLTVHTVFQNVTYFPNKHSVNAEMKLSFELKELIKPKMFNSVIIYLLTYVG